MEKLTDFVVNALVRNAEPEFSWLPIKIVSTAANAARRLCSMPLRLNRYLLCTPELWIYKQYTMAVRMASTSLFITYTTWWGLV